MLLFQIGLRVNSRSAGAGQLCATLQRLLTCDYRWHIVIGITMAGRSEKDIMRAGYRTFRRVILTWH
jgi:hypothetical protein